jgi:hypothetical protein
MYLKSYLIMGAFPFTLDSGSSSLLSLVECIIPISCSEHIGLRKVFEYTAPAGVAALEVLDHLLVYIQVLLQ